MSLSTEIFQSFSRAAANDPSLQERPHINVEALTFHQVLEPIQKILDEDSVYGQYETGVFHQITELHQMCKDAQVMRTTDDDDLKRDCNSLLNVLQGIIESAQESKDGYLPIDYEYLYELPRLTDVIRGNASIYKQFMNFPAVAEALNEVADNIDAAQARLWAPEVPSDYKLSSDFDTNVSAKNDDEYEQQEIA